MRSSLELTAERVAPPQVEPSPDHHSGSQNGTFIDVQNVERIQLSFDPRGADPHLQIVTARGE